MASLKETLDPIKNGDAAAEYAALAETDPAVFDPSNYMLQLAMAENFDYEILDAAIDGDVAAVQVSITNIDSMSIVMQLLAAAGDAETDEDLLAALATILEGEIPTFTETVFVYFVNDADEGWTIDEEASAAFTSVLGGIPTSAELDYEDMFAADLEIEE